MAISNLKKEFDFFVAHQDELVKKYKGKFLVIKNRKVIGAHPTIRAAYAETQQEHPLGTFAIYHCIPGPEAYTQVFHSRAIFH